MPDTTHTYGGWTNLDGFTVSFTNGVGGAPANHGDPGSVLNWTAHFSYGSDQNIDNIVTDVGGDGILVAADAGSGPVQAGEDFISITGETYTFSGYTFTTGGVTYPIFQHGTLDYYIPLPVNGDPNPGIIPTSGSSDVYGATATLDLAALCFAEGTEIMTPEGETVVEQLQIGDDIRTADGRITQVKWVGRQTVFPRMAAEKMQPVRIGSGALGKGLPYQELVVTADHGMVIDGLVINASALINGSTIDWVPMDELPEVVTYYHVETDAHEVILANGAPAETFMDAAGRSAFDNHQEYLDLYGVERIIPEMPHLRITTQRLLPDAIKARLGLADLLGFPYLIQSA